MSKHTPGPWRNHGTGIITGGPDDCTSVAETPKERWAVSEMYAQADEAEANAHLIAAAPDMADALKGMLACGRNCGADVAPGECCHHVTAALAALNKAGLGESAPSDEAGSCYDPCERRDINEGAKA